MESSAAKILCAVMLAAVIPAANAAVTNRNYSAPQYLSINGVACPELVSWSGGDASARVVVESAVSAGGTAKKHIGNPAYEPIFMVVGLPLSPALQNGLADLCANRTSSLNLLLTDGDGTKLEATNAQLIEARFPALEGMSKHQWRLTLVFRPVSTRPISGGSTGSAGAGLRPKGAISSNFRVTLGSFPVNQVSGIEAFTITRVASAGGVGAERDYAATPGSTQIPDLNIIITQTGAAAWAGWRDDFIVQGNSDDPKEKSGSLEIMGSDLQKVLLALQFSHVGIKRFAQEPGVGEGPDKYRAELYCEEMSVAIVPVTGTTTPAATPATTPAPAPAPAETASTDSKTPAKEPTKTPGTTTTETTSAPVPTDTAPADSKTQADPKAPAKEPEKTPEAAPAETVPAPAPTAGEKPVTNPEDKGPRDPADFPRADGTRRTQYSAVREKGFVQETANYTAKAKSDDLMAFYEQRLKGNGWEETARYENDNGTDRAHQIISTWKKANRTASLTFMDTATGNVEIQVVLQERK